MVKQSQNLSPLRKKIVYTQTKQPITSQKKMVQYSNRAKTFHQSEKDGTILKQGQNLSPVRKRWYNTQTGPKPVKGQKRWYYTQTKPKPDNRRKKIVQYSNRSKICHQ